MPGPPGPATRPKKRASPAAQRAARNAVRATRAAARGTFTDPISMNEVPVRHGIVLNKTMYDPRELEHWLNAGRNTVPHSRRRLNANEANAIRRGAARIADGHNWSSLPPTALQSVARGLHSLGPAMLTLAGKNRGRREAMKNAYLDPRKAAVTRVMASQKARKAFWKTWINELIGLMHGVYAEGGTRETIAAEIKRRLRTKFGFRQPPGGGAMTLHHPVHVTANVLRGGQTFVHLYFPHRHRLPHAEHPPHVWLEFDSYTPDRVACRISTAASWWNPDTNRHDVRLYPDFLAVVDALHDEGHVVEAHEPHSLPANIEKLERRRDRRRRLQLLT